MSRVQSGVVRIEADVCDGSSEGTGFELSPRVVATVEHVVDGASSVRLMQGDTLVANASIIGADPDQDLALLLTDKPLGGQPLRLSPDAPQLGDAVAAVGFPLGLPLSVTQGTVSGLDRTVSIDDYERQHLIQTDAALNPGNSGGPLLEVKTGEVVGLADLKETTGSGLGFAVSSTAALSEFTAWRAKPQPVRAVGCPSTPDAMPATVQVPPFVLLPPVTGNTGSPPPAGNTGNPPPSGNTGNPPPTGNSGTPPPPPPSPPPSGNTGNSPSSGNTGNTTPESGDTGNSGPGTTSTGNTGSATTPTTGNTGATGNS